MAKKDFLTGLLQGLYQSGVGNPEVQRANQARVDEQQGKLNQSATEQGLVPATLADNHPVRSKIGSFISQMFGGPSTPLQTAFQPDPTKPVSTISSTGSATLNPPGYAPQPGEYKVPMKDALPLIRTQANRATTPSLTWEKATPEQQNLAKSLYEGRIRTSDLSFRDRGATTSLANEYAIKSGLPPFKSYQGDVAAGTAKSFGYGKFGQSVNSLNTAMGHVGSVFDAYKELENTDVNFLNTPINKLKEETNDPNVIKLGIALNALSGELATVFKGSSGTDQEIKGWKDYLSRDLTPTQAVGAMQQIDDLLRSRQSALENTRDAGRGRGEGSLISPHAEETRKKINAPRGTSSKPKTVIQNGHTYNLNPLTGKYE